MKKLLLLLFIVGLSKVTFAQQPAPLIWGSAANQDSIWAMDTLSWLPVINLEPTVTGSVVSGITGLAYDPTAFKSYAILKIGGSRYLAEISLQTGSCAVMGDLLDNFSSITFDEFGQLYGATGDGATVPSSLYRINKATAASTLVFAMGNGADGEVICYNRYDNKMYHWSGNGTVVYESWPIASTSYTPLNIVPTGTTGGETFGALSVKPGDFIISNINSNLKHASTTGAYGNILSFNPDDLRGLIMPPRFAVNSTSLCAKTASLYLYANCLQLYDSVYYNWGDGNMTQLLASATATAAAMHTYTAVGNYTVTIQLHNGSVPKSTIQTFAIVVNPNPLVTITGVPALCAGGSTTLSASGGGTSQWYKAGLAISGATLSALTVTATGWYNMIKTNQNGCSDSASTGVQVIAAPVPTLVANSTSICTGGTTTITASGVSTFTVSGGATVVSPTVTTQYSVTGTASTGCLAGNVAIVTVTVKPLPLLTVMGNTAAICLGESTTFTASGVASYSWNNTPGASTIAVSPTVTTTYTVSGTGTDGCANTTTITQSVSACTGLGENGTKIATVRLIPNPTTGKFYMENVSENANIEVYDALGKLILKSTAQTGRTNFDLGGFNSGIYFVRVSQNDKVVAQIKVIKE